MASGRFATYDYRITFRAPRNFVFTWCTDYRSDDARREGESYRRKIVERTPRRVVYEDLEESKDGWYWARHVVRLTPPSGWRSDSIGNRREFRLVYRLRKLPGDRTELRFTGRRRPIGLASSNPSARHFHQMMETSWHHFRTELERDYRRSRGNRSGGRKRSSRSVRR